MDPVPNEIATDYFDGYDLSLYDGKFSTPAATDEATQWLVEQAIKFKVSSVELPAELTQPISSLASEAKIVGLGETTHGTSEHFSLKTEIILDLVKSHGVSAVAIESSTEGSEALTSYVAGTSHSLDDAMKGLLSIWQVQEVSHLLQELRAINGLGSIKVSFVPIDDRIDTSFEERDLNMAANTMSLLNTHGQVALWAHNSHVSTSSTYKSMGHVMRQALGTEYRVVGFSASEGTYRALSNDKRTRREYAFDDSPVGSIEHFFEASHLENALVDLQEISTSNTASSFLSEPRLMRNIGGASAASGGQHWPDVVSESFDMLIYTKATQAARAYFQGS